MYEFNHEQIQVHVAETTRQMAERAAKDVAAEINRRAEDKDKVNIVVAGGESQAAFLKALSLVPDVPWGRVNGFTLDEFFAPNMPPECTVASQVRRDLFARVPIKGAHHLDHAAADPDAECRRYATLIEAHPADMVFLGIGRSGHLGFNEPGDVDFEDPKMVRVVDICEASKRQLEEDPNFKALDAIPNKGLTMTIPKFMSTPHVFVVVPLATKAPIIKRFFESDLTTDLPATVLKHKTGTRMYLDPGSFSLYKEALKGKSKLAPA